MNGGLIRWFRVQEHVLSCQTYVLTKLAEFELIDIDAIHQNLALGRLIYVDDMATNNVLRQFYRNRQIKPGRQIESGSSIDLEVGLNSDDKETYVPNVKDMKYLRAVDAIHESSLNVSKAVFDKSVRNYADSLNAVVYKQSPAPSKNPVGMGSGVSIYLSLDVRN